MKKFTLLSAILLCTVCIAYGQWTYTNLSEPKSAMAYGVLGDSLILAGGYGASGSQSDVEFYDPITGQGFVMGSNLSVARGNVTGVVSGGKFFCAGGAVFLQTPLTTVDIYDEQMQQWTVSQLSQGRFMISAVSAGNKIFFAGGFVDWYLNGSDVVDIYDLQTQTWSTDTLSEPRGGLAAAVLGDLVIIAGGMIDQNTFSDRVDIYNLNTNTWETAALSVPRALLEVAVVGNKVLIAGGITEMGVPSDVVDIYDISNNSWSTASLFTPRALIKAATLHGKTYFAGGGTFNMGWSDYSNIIDIYNEADSSWSIYVMPVNCLNPAIASIGDYLVIAGGENENGVLDTVQVFYEPSEQPVWITQGAGFSVPRLILNIFPVNDQVVWASAFDCQDFTVTTDGGNTWTKKTIPGVPDVFNSMICAIDANTAWMAMFSPGVSGNEGVYKTTDGGDTWTKQTTAAFSGAGSWADIIYFWDANTGVCAGDPINEEFEIYTTTNGGTNWIQVPGSQIPDPLPGEYANYAIYAVSGNTIWFTCNLSGRVYKSSDFGNNWSVTETPGGLAGPNWGCPIAFKDQNNGLVLSGETTIPIPLDYTDDGGSNFYPMNYTGNVFNWAMCYVPGTNGTYASVGIPNTTNYGLTFTNDNGLTWIEEPNISDIGLSACAFINDSVGWVGSFSTDESDGIYKFNNVLALVSDFSVPDTLVPPGSEVQFQNLSKGRLTGYLWTFEGGNPSTSNLKTPPPVVYNTMGSYDVSLQVTGKLGTITTTREDYIVVGYTGISQTTNAPSQINVYPNPSADKIIIELFGLERKFNATVSIYGSTSQEMISEKTVNPRSEIDVSHLSPGLYFIKVENNQIISFSKFIKN